MVTACLLTSVAHAESVNWSDGFSFQVKSDDRLNLMFSPFTHHYTPSDEHHSVWLVGLERQRRNGNLSGITYFSNSFGQPSTYIYPWGQTYPNLAGVQGLYAKWSAGLLYGYVEPYENKVPLNVNGFSPAIIPSIGIERNGFGAQLNFLGVAGVMLQFNLPIGH